MMLRYRSAVTLVIAVIVQSSCEGITPGYYQRNSNRQTRDSLNIWLEPEQARLLSGFRMQIFIVNSGRLIRSVKPSQLEQFLPIIPQHVSTINFTWSAGQRKKYDYEFFNLTSLQPSVLSDPVVSVSQRGRVPTLPSVFTVSLSCMDNASGEASFSFGMDIRRRKNRKTLTGFPLLLHMKKDCRNYEQDRCQHFCSSGNNSDVQCSSGSQSCVCRTANDGNWTLGTSCSVPAVCFPRCLNGGVCESPGRCRCVRGFQGPHCEGGICRRRCLNGGKCVQKDKCKCNRGHYGQQCEYSRCLVTCQNGGICRGKNRCRCLRGFTGRHCQTVVTRHKCNGRKCRCNGDKNDAKCRRRNRIHPKQ